MFSTLLVLFLFGSSAYAETAVACDGSNLNLKCPDNETIRVNHANYGRSSLQICPTNVTNQATNCTEKKATFIVAARCNNNQNCTIPVNSTHFGDPCPGTSKYLLVNYTCSNVSEPPVFCGLNEHHTSCGSNCEATCSNTSPPPCNGSCIVNKCVCNDGYVRDPATNVCMLLNYCPSSGNPDETHEEFTLCGASCEATCRRRRPGFLCDLLSTCQPGYICEHGYFRDSNTGQCVLPFECPRTHSGFWPWDF